MMYKKLIITGIIVIFGQAIFAQTIPVSIKPTENITTSNPRLQEGDNLNFVVTEDVFLNSKIYLKKDETVSGTITSLEKKDFLYKPALIYVENFVTKNIHGQKIKLDGIIYKKGNDYWMITQFIPVPLFTLKGGEVKISPQKDIFTLYLKEKND